MGSDGTRQREECPLASCGWAVVSDRLRAAAFPRKLPATLISREPMFRNFHRGKTSPAVVVILCSTKFKVQNNSITIVTLIFVEHCLKLKLQNASYTAAKKDETESVMLDKRNKKGLKLIKQKSCSDLHQTHKNASGRRPRQQSLDPVFVSLAVPSRLFSQTTRKTTLAVLRKTAGGLDQSRSVLRTPPRNVLTHQKVLPSERGLCLGG